MKVAMGFFNDLQCAFVGCSSSTPAYANIVNNLTTRMNVACTPTVVSSQATTCNLISDHCSHMNFSCANVAQQSATCAFDDLVKSAVAALQGQNQAAMAAALNLPPLSSQQDINNAISTEVSTNCSAKAISDTTLLANLICKNSAHVDMNVLSQLTATTACGVATAAGIASRAASHEKNLVAEILTIAVFVIVVLLYIVFLVFIVNKIRASGKSV